MLFLHYISSFEGKGYYSRKILLEFVRYCTSHQNFHFLLFLLGSFYISRADIANIFHKFLELYVYDGLLCLSEKKIFFTNFYI